MMRHELICPRLSFYEAEHDLLLLFAEPETANDEFQEPSSASLEDKWINS
jgi:hypothetical protein